MTHKSLMDRQFELGRRQGEKETIDAIYKITYVRPSTDVSNYTLSSKSKFGLLRARITYLINIQNHHKLQNSPWELGLTNSKEQEEFYYSPWDKQLKQGCSCKT